MATNRNSKLPRRSRDEPMGELKPGKNIVSVGVTIPGDQIEHITHQSSKSLLDADIVIYVPEIYVGTYENDTYQGRKCLSDDGSFRAREYIKHWRSEITACLEAGKVVFVLLSAPVVVFAATGSKDYSGTGRNTRVTRHVDLLSSYAAIPTSWSYTAAHGTAIKLLESARAFSRYWSEFSQISEYLAYITGANEPIFAAQSGNRILGASVRRGDGILVALPWLKFDDPNLLTVRANGAERWNSEALILGRKFAASLVALCSALKTRPGLAPPPEWVEGMQFALPEESAIDAKIASLIEQVQTIERNLVELREQRITAGSARALLYEQGKPLEAAVLESLKLMGFDAANLVEGGSEFDAVFTSDEGRFIGEVEGKDTKAINIEKFSQLERNLNEDFARDGVDSFAKGVLFGNAYRLTPFSQQRDPFTEKCHTAAKRLKVALVHTPDLFNPSRYLKSSGDKIYAESCRRAIFNSNGDVVIFPDTPNS